MQSFGEYSSPTDLIDIITNAEFMFFQAFVNIVIWHFDFQTIIIGHGWVLLGSVCSLCNVAIQGSNHNSLSMFTKRRKYTFPLCPKSIKIVVYGNTHIITC